MHAPGQRQRFLLARALLRWQLANRLSTSPEKVVLARSPQDKPCLVQPPAQSLPASVTFNLSHSGEWVAVAIAHRALIGVDLEHPHRSRPVAAIAEQFLHPEETRLLMSFPDAVQQSMFYRLWTHKEAYLKARGNGITQELGRVNFAPWLRSAKSHAPFSFPDPECSGTASGIWQGFYWNSPVQDKRPWFLSLVINTPQTSVPTLWRTLPAAETDRKIKTKPN